MKVTGKLVGVPISLGRDQAAGTCLKVNFYVLDCPSYHFIIGLDLLKRVDGAVLCGSRRLDIRLGQQGGGGRYIVPLATRSEAYRSPCYQLPPPSMYPLPGQPTQTAAPPPPPEGLKPIPEASTA